MLPAVHLVLSLGMASCLDFRHTRRYTAILALGLAGMAPDLDHFLPLYREMRLFHNMLILVIVPLIILLLAHLVETRGGGTSSGMQRFGICLLVILTSHLLLDIISGNAVGLAFPASAATFSVLPAVLIESPHLGTMLVTTDILWLLLLVLVLSGNIAQKKIYWLYEEQANEPMAAGRGHTLFRPSPMPG